MNYFVNKILDIKDLDWKMYNHLLELNIKLAKREFTKPRLIETYGNIICLHPNINFITIYGNFSMSTQTISKLDLMRKADCVIDYDGKIIKNRWGDYD